MPFASLWHTDVFSVACIRCRVLVFPNGNMPPRGPRHACAIGLWLCGQVHGPGPNRCVCMGCVRYVHLSSWLVCRSRVHACGPHVCLTPRIHGACHIAQIHTCTRAFVEDPASIELVWFGHTVDPPHSTACNSQTAHVAFAKHFSDHSHGWVIRWIGQTVLQATLRGGTLRGELCKTC